MLCPFTHPLGLANAQCLGNQGHYSEPDPSEQVQEQHLVQTESTHLKQISSSLPFTTLQLALQSSLAACREDALWMKLRVFQDHNSIC